MPCTAAVGKLTRTKSSAVAILPLLPLARDGRVPASILSKVFHSTVRLLSTVVSLAINFPSKENTRN